MRQMDWSLSLAIILNVIISPSVGVGLSTDFFTVISVDKYVQTGVDAQLANVQPSFKMVHIPSDTKNPP
jgi:hypothetical protein